MIQGSTMKNQILSRVSDSVISMQQSITQGGDVSMDKEFYRLVLGVSHQYNSQQLYEVLGRQLRHEGLERKVLLRLEEGKLVFETARADFSRLRGMLLEEKDLGEYRLYYQGKMLGKGKKAFFPGSLNNKL